MFSVTGASPQALAAATDGAGAPLAAVVAGAVVGAGVAVPPPQAPTRIAMLATMAAGLSQGWDRFTSSPPPTEMTFVFRANDPGRLFLLLDEARASGAGTRALRRSDDLSRRRLGPVQWC